MPPPVSAREVEGLLELGFAVGEIAMEAKCDINCLRLLELPWSSNAVIRSLRAVKGGNINSAIKLNKLTLRDANLPPNVDEFAEEFGDEIPGLARISLDDIGVKGPKTTYGNEEVCSGIRRKSMMPMLPETSPQKVKYRLPWIAGQALLILPDGNPYDWEAPELVEAKVHELYTPFPSNGESDSKDIPNSGGINTNTPVDAAITTSLLIDNMLVNTTIIKLITRLLTPLLPYDTEVYSGLKSTDLLGIN
ncbi:hypothetical protein MGYG_04437 [Nannizzia gypsea CBS 118893]|uniref:Uncharacterized protein n=1 Tax=Arthroderma gypseum (strain ATCC MYA-4604 / CBS 118893) TaxID=535722 RepID=E4USY1_ARTGP|nr:hypothetical protein MGYG_04437 [Nannizzia gypsea CBS 118893]EFR01430.1 hypothetical protein MGYG_04437 [Nannizzia gypsea CBS 118893]